LALNPETLWGTLYILPISANNFVFRDPAPPPEPVNDRKRAMAILPYTKMPDTDELTFQKGDIFFIHNDLGDGWIWVTAHRTGEQGLVFRDLMTDLDQNIDPNAVFPWFHRNLTKDEAVKMLVRGKKIEIYRARCMSSQNSNNLV
jgi:hypothetical protein